MVTDDFIWLSAKTIIRAHNGSAALVCAENADKWNRRGDVEAAELWLQILQAVRELELNMVLNDTPPRR